MNRKDFYDDLSKKDRIILNVGICIILFLSNTVFLAYVVLNIAFDFHPAHVLVAVISLLIQVLYVRMIKSYGKKYREIDEEDENDNSDIRKE